MALENTINYGPYVELVEKGHMVVNTSDINIDNWDNHFNSVLNILKDGIELDQVHHMFISVNFGNDVVIELSIMDYFMNIIMWYLIVRTNSLIEPKHIFFEESVTRKTIKNYIDDFFIDVNRKKFSNVELNNILDDALYHFSFIDQFAMYLANTINLEDTIDLMNASEEFYDLIHADLSSVPIEDVKNVGMKYTNQAIDIMKNSRDILGYDHCLADSWRSGEGINPRQYKEFSINIGSKPDGQGGVFPSIINRSFITGGVKTPTDYFIDSSTGRTAQILAKMNVGSSGYFARLLGLNNMDSYLHEDPNYICDTKEFEVITIKSDRMLSMLNNRYYRFNPEGMERVIKYKKDKDLIGKTIYLRSPITCASNSRGDGICYRCYGDLAYTTKDINIGKIAAEELSSKLTQILLSAKHLLETVIKKLNWPKKFFDIFEVEGNIIKLIPDINFRDYKLIIDPENIELENDDDYGGDNNSEDSYSSDEDDSDTYNEYVTEFSIQTPDKEIYAIHTLPDVDHNDDGYDKLYIGQELNTIIRKKGEAEDGKITVNLNDLRELNIFYMMIHNNELSKTLNLLQDMLNKNNVTKSMDKNQLLQAIFETIIEGNLDVSGIHLEMILSSQIRSVENTLEKPEWQYPNEPYEILTLNQALINNPSVTITLSYQGLSKVLYNPLTFRKNGPSFMDLFFMERPQNYLSDTTNIRPAIKETDKEDNLITPVTFYSRKDAMEEEEDDTDI